MAKEEAETDNQTEASDKVENHLAKMMACQEIGREKARKLRTKSVVEALEPRAKKLDERAEIFEESNEFEQKILERNNLLKRLRSDLPVYQPGEMFYEVVERL